MRIKKETREKRPRRVGGQAEKAQLVSTRVGGYIEIRILDGEVGVEDELREMDWLTAATPGENQMRCERSQGDRRKLIVRSKNGAGAMELRSAVGVRRA